MPPPHLKCALLGLVCLALAPCLLLALLQPAAAAAAADPLLASPSSSSLLQRFVQRTFAAAAARQPQIAASLHGADRHRPRRRPTSLIIASFNIRYSKDANYDSAHAPLRRLGRAITRSTQLQQDVDDAPPRHPPYNAANPSLRQKYWGERSWFLRGPRIADTVLFHNWDIIAMQEVLDAPYSNLRQWLGDDYATVGVGRNDGARGGEAAPIWWKRDLFDLVPASDGGVGAHGVEHFWLSPTPEKVGTVGWDAALTRMCTHVSLRIRETGELLHVFSTHYDHQGVIARRESSRLILRRAQQAAQRTKEWQQRKQHDDRGRHGREAAEPLVILIGDLNSPRNESSWTSLVGGHYSVSKNETGSSTGSSFLDTALSVPTRHTSPYLSINEDKLEADLASGSRPPKPFSSNFTTNERAHLSLPYGPLRTFTDFQPSHRTAVEDRLDFIMLLDNGAVLDQTRNDTVLQGTKPDPSQQRKRTQDGRWKIRSHGTLSSWSEVDAGFLISDHRPVVTRIESTS